MIAAVQEHIKEYGGKNGVLKYLHDYHPEMREHLAPMRILKQGERISQQLFDVIKKAAEQYPYRKLMNRRSLPGDRDGMVDYLPTDYVPLYIVNDPEKLMKWVNQENGLQHKIGSAACHDMTLSITPQIPHELYTVTEHPNQLDCLFVDKGATGHAYGGEAYKVHHEMVYHNTKVDTLKDMGSIYDVVSIARHIRSLRLFDENERLQYEIGIAANYKPYLFQVKKFCDLFPSYPKELAELFDDNDAIRIMGNIPADGTSFHHIEGESLHTISELEQTQQEPFVFSTRNVKTANTLNPQTPYMIGFLTSHYKLLYHNLTGPSQLALKNNGFVFLGVGRVIQDYVSISYENLFAKKIAKQKTLYSY